MRKASLFFVFLTLSPVVAQEAANSSEHLSPYGIARPVLIVAAEMPKELGNKDNIAVLDARTDAPPAGFRFLKRIDDEPQSGKVGVHIPPEAAFRIKGRTMSNVGKGAVTLRLAKSQTLAPRSIQLEGRRTADYNELRRCAAHRADANPYPPKQLAAPFVATGTLVIIGGGAITPDIGKRFFEAGGGIEGHFVVLPIAVPDPVKTRPEEAFIRRMGAKSVTAIPYREQKDLESPEVMAILKKATGIWFGGGRQWNFVDAYEGTNLPELFREVLSRGGVIGGSSAGATIQGDYLVRGAPAGPNIMMCEGYEQALGFLPGVAIDQHFSARNRFKDMSALVAKYPQFLGIGLDEATAIVVQGSIAEILGKGKVHFYDRRKPGKDGEKDYESYPAGTKYDLSKRQRIGATGPAENKRPLQN
jgi:cyanophycinase